MPCCHLERLNLFTLVKEEEVCQDCDLVRTIFPEQKISAGFATTRWSLIAACRDERESDQEALGQLCRIYWRPIFAFVCRRGYSVPDAQDLTQDYLLSIIRGNFLDRANPNRGRFRSLLRKGLQDFLNDENRRRNAHKRGGAIDFVSWDDWMAEAPSQLSFPMRALHTWSPERIFDLRWAATVVEQALNRLAEECEGRGRRRVFDVLCPYLTSERNDVHYAALSVTLGVTTALVKRLLHQLRLRYRILLREEVMQTVEKAEDVDGEIRYLCAALAAAEAAP
jgi:RNA polymerase sigma-70 factor (ECF subfamily)